MDVTFTDQRMELKKQKKEEAITSCNTNYSHKLVIPSFGS